MMHKRGPIVPGALSRGTVALTALVRLLLVVLLGTGPTIQPVLAYASPPDTSWVPGVYDDADYDDVVALLASATGAIGGAAVGDGRPVPVLAGHPPQTTRGATPVDLLSQDPSRAPPRIAPPACCR